MQTLTGIADRIAAITAASSNNTPSPPHDVMDRDKFNTLVDSMLAAGWSGAPIVVHPDGDDALTGSHRIAAAVECWREHGVDIPIPRVGIDELCATFGVDWDALLAEQLELFDSPAAAADWAAAEAGRMLPAEVVDYLGYDVDACPPW